MKYLLVVLLFLLYHHFSFSQDGTIDQSSLFEYSFPLRPLNKDLTFNSSGTCFFMEYKTRYYVVSARHVFTGRYATNNKLMKGFTQDPKYAWVIQFKKEGQPQNFLLPLRSRSGKGLLLDRKISDTSYLDIAALEIPKDSILMSTYFKIHNPDTSINIVKGDSVVYCGYPMAMQKKDTFMTNRYSGIALDFSFYMLKTNQTGPYGCSGSPMLIKKDGKYHLYGVFFASDKPTETPAYAMSIKIIIDLINEHTK